MIALGVADAIVDLVETGSTLAANRLSSSTSSAATKRCSCRTRPRRHAPLADRVVRRLEGVVIARSYSLLEYNVPEAKLAEAEKITPGFESPTVNKLEEPGWFAVRAMVKRGEVIEIMERLEAARRHRHSRNHDHQLPAVKTIDLNRVRGVDYIVVPFEGMPALATSCSASKSTASTASPSTWQ